MSSSSTTAGKTAGSKRTQNRSTARIGRWRRHASNILATLSRNPHMMDQLELIARFEDKEPTEIVIDRLCVLRGNAKVIHRLDSRCASESLFYAMMDTNREDLCSNRCLNSLEKQVVGDMISHLCSGLPGCFTRFSRGEKLALMRFYRKGDMSLRDAGIRSMRAALSQKEEP